MEFKVLELVASSTTMVRCSRTLVQPATVTHEVVETNSLAAEEE